MTVVVIYGFTGTYSGSNEYEWNHPDLGARHKCMLFLRQSDDSDQSPAAVAECRRYGFTDIEGMRFGKLQIDALNTDRYRGFSAVYEGTLKEGSALIFYPNNGPGNVAP